MMRLIDADALYRKFLDGEADTPEEKDANQIARYIIRHAPTIDAVNVVRCKDCKNNDSEKQICALTGVHFTEMDFCSYGEKK